MPTYLPETVSCLWPGSIASIPEGFIRETVYDGFYIHVASGTDTPLVTGGFLNHGHIANSHYHTMVAGSGGSAYDKDAAGTSTYRTSLSTHIHASANSAVVTVTINADNNTPSYYEFIAIKPSSTTRNGIPLLACGLWGDAYVPPTNWDLIDSGNNRLIKIAAASLGGGLVGGVSGHTHTENAHGLVHSANSSNASANNINNTEGSEFAGISHYHVLTVNSATEILISSTTLPAFETLGLVKNNTGSESLVSGLILLCSGGDAPDGWERKNLTVDFDMIACTNLTENITVTGGNRVHLHSATEHNHTIIQGEPTVFNGNVGMTAAASSAFGHEHVWTISTSGSIINNCTSKASYPLYITSILLKCTDPTLYDPVGAPTIVPQRMLCGIGG